MWLLHIWCMCSKGVGWGYLRFNVKHTATHCNTLQHTVIHRKKCNSWIRAFALQRHSYGWHATHSYVWLTTRSCVWQTTHSYVIHMPHSYVRHRTHSHEWHDPCILVYVLKSHCMRAFWSQQTHPRWGVSFLASFDLKRREEEHPPLYNTTPSGRFFQGGSFSSFSSSNWNMPKRRPPQGVVFLAINLCSRAIGLGHLRFNIYNMKGSLANNEGLWFCDERT